MNSAMQDFWNNRFADKDFIYGKAPNEFFRQQIDKLSPGKLLLPADGEGRNAVYAANNGWEVTAVDYSTTARQKALQLAKEFNTEINYELGNLAEFDFGVNRFDAAAFIYVLCTPAPFYYKRRVSKRYSKFKNRRPYYC